MEVRDFCVSKTVPLTQNLHNIFFPEIRKTPSFNQILKLQKINLMLQGLTLVTLFSSWLEKTKTTQLQALLYFLQYFFADFKRFWLYCESIWVKGEKHGEDLLPLCSSSPWCWSAQSYISLVLWRLKRSCSNQTKKILVSGSLACTLINPQVLWIRRINLKYKSKYLS